MKQKTEAQGRIYEVLRAGAPNAHTVSDLLGKTGLRSRSTISHALGGLVRRKLVEVLPPGGGVERMWYVRRAAAQ